MTLFPEIEQALVQAATTRRARARGWMRSHPRGAAAVAIATLSVAGSATAAGMLIERTTVAEGPTAVSVTTATTPTSSYRVQANISGEKVCLSYDISQRGRPDGNPSSCEPKVMEGALPEVGLGVINGEQNLRLLSGVVNDQVASVDATGTDQKITLRRFDGAPGAYFSVLVSRPGPVKLVALDKSGHKLGAYDSSSFGPIGRGDFAGTRER